MNPAQAKPRPKHSQGGGSGFLPPPPRLQQPGVVAAPVATTLHSISTSNSSQQNNASPLLDFDNSFSGTNSAKPTTADASLGVEGNDPWGDFTSAA